MKRKISISIDEALIEQVEAKVQTKLFRNKSHFIEYAVSKMVEE